MAHISLDYQEKGQAEYSDTNFAANHRVYLMSKVPRQQTREASAAVTRRVQASYAMPFEITWSRMCSTAREAGSVYSIPVQEASSSTLMVTKQVHRQLPISVALRSGCCFC